MNNKIVQLKGDIWGIKEYLGIRKYIRLDISKFFFKLILSIKNISYYIIVGLRDQSLLSAI
jgi:hypothetical protein